MIQAKDARRSGEAAKVGSVPSENELRMAGQFPSIPRLPNRGSIGRCGCVTRLCPRAGRQPRSRRPFSLWWGACSAPACVLMNDRWIPELPVERDGVAGRELLALSCGMRPE